MFPRKKNKLVSGGPRGSSKFTSRAKSPGAREPVPYYKHKKLTSSQNKNKKMKTEFIENDSPATKPKRAFFTDDDKKFLLNYFQKNPYPNDREKSYLSKKLRKPVAKITNWYKNERARQGRTCQKKILRKQRELSEISDYEETDYEPIPKRRKLRIPYKSRLKSETDSSGMF